MMAARWAAEITRMAIGRHPAWTYRGVVTYGKSAISDRGTYFVGPAVVEAAECLQNCVTGRMPSEPRLRMAGEAVRELPGESPGILLKRPPSVSRRRQ